MKSALVAFITTFLWCHGALAWGQEGHSIIAEIAEHRLETPTLDKVRKLLRVEVPTLKGGADVSLASVASWADDYRAAHRETTNWHFVNIPVERLTYDPAVDCPPADWAVESHQYARSTAYDIPDGAILEMNYYNEALPVIDRQLALAGVRLARYLTDTLKPTAACP